jgi:hypothetical protein
MQVAQRFIGPPIYRDEILERINEVAKTRLFISGEELIKQYCTGGVPDPGPVSDVLILLDLLDPEDIIFSEYVYGRHVNPPR